MKEKCPYCNNSGWMILEVRIENIPGPTPTVGKTWEVPCIFCETGREIAKLLGVKQAKVAPKE